MTIQETFSEWFRQLDQREQSVLLEYVKERYFARSSSPHTADSADASTAKLLADLEKAHAVCPTCKRGY